MTGIKTAYRLEIEGLGIEAVTDPALEQTLSDGRVRVVGLMREGMQIEEQVDIARAEIESSGMMVSIVDRQHDSIWTSHLGRRPTTRTWMIDSVDSAVGAKFYVASTAGFAADDVVHVGTEALLVDSVGSDGGGAYLDVLTAGRGYWSTAPQHHFTREGADLVRPIVTLTYPVGIEGRRARLYRYVLGVDDMQGDGTQIWLGICSTDAKLSDGCVWSFQLDPITKILEQDLGSDLENPIGLRGIHYPVDAPFDFVFGIAGTSTLPTEGSPAPTNPSGTKTAAIRMVGFWETQEAFCEELTDYLRDALDSTTTPVTSGNGVTVAPLSNMAVQEITARASGSTWEIYIKAGADGGLAFVTAGSSGLTGGRAFGVEGDPVFGAISDPSNTISNGDTVSYVFRDAQMPRGVIGSGPFASGRYDPLADFSGADVYPASLVAADTDDVLTLVYSPPGGGDELEVAMSIVEVDDTEGRIRGATLPSEPILYSPRLGLPEIKIRRLYAEGTLYDFLTEIAASAPEDANKGAQPFIIADDMSLTEAVFDDGARGIPLLRRRVYASGAEVSFGELVSHECRLLRIFPHLDSTGRLTFSKLQLPTATSPVDFTIDDSNRLPDEELPTWERSALWGSINTVIIQTGYSYIDEEHKGLPLIVKDATALSTRKRPLTLDVEPLSGDGYADGARHGVDWTADDAVAIASGVLGIFGRPYITIRFEAPYTLATMALVGSVGRVAFPRMPNTLTGERGLDEAVGMVVARSWALDQEERIQLTMIVTDEPIAGYAPSATLSSGSDGGGDEWTFTLSLLDPEGVASMAPSGVDATDLFQVGDVVEVVEWNAASQSPAQGTITAISASSVTIQFGATFTAPSQYYMRFAAAGQVDEEQEDFAFWADGDFRVSFGSGDTPASVWAA